MSLTQHLLVGIPYPCQADSHSIFPNINTDILVTCTRHRAFGHIAGLLIYRYKGSHQNLSKVIAQSSLSRNLSLVFSLLNNLMSKSSSSCNCIRFSSWSSRYLRFSSSLIFLVIDHSAPAYTSQLNIVKSCIKACDTARCETDIIAIDDHHDSCSDRSIHNQSLYPLE